MKLTAVDDALRSYYSLRSSEEEDDSRLCEETKRRVHVDRCVWKQLETHAGLYDDGHAGLVELPTRYTLDTTHAAG